MVPHFAGHSHPILMVRIPPSPHLFFRLLSRHCSSSMRAVDAPCRYGLLKAASTSPGFCGDTLSPSKCVEACKGLAAGTLTYDTVCRTCVIQKVMTDADVRRLFFDAGCIRLLGQSTAASAMRAWRTWTTIAFG